MELQKLLGSSSIVALLVSEVTTIVTCYYVAVCLLLDVDPVVFMLYNRGLVRAGVVGLAIIIGLYLQDLYEDLRITQRVLLLQQMCLALGLAFLLQALLNYVDSSLVFPRWVMLLGSSLVLLVLPILRMVFGELMKLALHAERIVFLGWSPLVEQIQTQMLERPERGFTPIGLVNDDGGMDPVDCPVLGMVDNLRQVAQQYHPDRIVVALEGPNFPLPENELLDLRFSGVQVENAASIYERLFDRVCLRELRPAQLIFAEELGPRPLTRRLQATYSTLVAALGLLVSLPLFLIAASLVKLTSKGPVFYKQRRVGLRGKQFTVYKFRSMYADAEAVTGAVWAKRGDPRITPVGKWLRRFRIDEIPQLFNVLRGDMVMVGPRPERPEFVETLIEQIPFYRQRLSVKPGITGWAQINYKYGDTLEDTMTKLEYDLYYIKHMTPAIDAYVMFHTAKVVLLGRGAQ